jgi:AmmeMemoRadiSam system protein A
VTFPGIPIRHVAPADQERLLAIARAAIHAHLTGARPPRLTRVDLPPALWRPGASFVTLRRDGRLRGCIGSLEPRRPLAVDVADNAVGSATRDPRFPPLDVAEEEGLEIKVSVLTPAEPMDVGSWAELVAQIRPGEDGLIIDDGRHRGTFLPSVWAQLPEVADFLGQLWLKAGLQPGDWPADLRVARYRTEEF